MPQALKLTQMLQMSERRFHPSFLLRFRHPSQPACSCPQRCPYRPKHRRERCCGQSDCTSHRGDANAPDGYGYDREQYCKRHLTSADSSLPPSATIRWIFHRVSRSEIGSLPQVPSLRARSQKHSSARLRPRQPVLTALYRTHGVPESGVPPSSSRSSNLLVQQVLTCKLVRAIKALW